MLRRAFGRGRRNTARGGRADPGPPPGPSALYRYDASVLASLWQHSDGTSAVAAGDHVGRWSDLSGNDQHMTQPTSGFRPLYTATGGAGGGPAVDMSGGAQWMFTADATLTDATYAVVARVAGNFGSLFEFQSSVGARYDRLLRFLVGSDFTGSKVSANRGTDLDVDIHTAGIWSDPEAAFHVYQIVIATAGAATVRVYRDGALKFTTAASVGVTARSGPLSLGAALDGSDQSSPLISEAKIYNSALSDADLAADAAALAAKWGI